MSEESTESLTDSTYWDRTWSGRVVPSPLNPRAQGLNGTLERFWHSFFHARFQALGIQPGDRLLEAGCGGSSFLPYFAREFRVVAEGIDNSREGCELSAAISRRSGVHTPLHEADILNPPASLRDRYKLVFSFGVAEHFTPTTSIIGAMATFAEPGGFLVTVIPNMSGIVGTIQRWVDPAIYGIHVPLSPAQLAEAHRSSGLVVLSAEYAMTACFSVVNFSGPEGRVPPAIGLRLTSWASKVVWLLQRIGLPELPNRWTSPYVVVVAQRSC